MRAKNLILSRLVVITASVALWVCATWGCAGPPSQPAKEAAPEALKVEPPAPPQPTKMAELPPPTLKDVGQAIGRIFKDWVVLDESRKPNFLVGDFNGDQSQDLAVILKPAQGKLSELNQEFPNWIAREPLQEVLAKPIVANPQAPKPPPNPAAGQTVRFEQRDILLAIIHGFGPKGWHDPEATQTHLLRDVVGTDMRTMTLKEAAQTYGRTKPFPSVMGDLILQTLIGQSGFLHFAGSTYHWYDPKNFKPQLPVAHPVMATRKPPIVSKSPGR
jgi:hypothetical protein